MSQQPREGISLLLPVRDQAAALERALPAWGATLGKLGRDYEIVLIDDASGEHTQTLINGTESKKGLAQSVANVKLVRHDTPCGFGASLRTGLALAQHPLIAYSGLDDGYHPDDLRTFLERLEEKDPETGDQLDLVNGFRAAKPLKGWAFIWNRAVAIFQRIVFAMPIEPPTGDLGRKARRYARIVRWLFGVRIEDVDSKFKLIRRRVLDRFPIQSDGEFVHAEILAKANFLKGMMGELPIMTRRGPFTPQAWPSGGPSKWEDGRKVFHSPEFTFQKAAPPIPPVLDIITSAG